MQLCALRLAHADGDARVLQIALSLHWRKTVEFRLRICGSARCGVRSDARRRMRSCGRDLVETEWHWIGELSERLICGAVARVNLQRALVAEGCYIVCEIVIVPGGRRFPPNRRRLAAEVACGLRGRGQRGKHARKAGGSGGGRRCGGLLHGMEHNARPGGRREEIPIRKTNGFQKRTDRLPVPE